MKTFYSLFILLLTHYSFSQYCSENNRFTEAEYFTINQVKTISNIMYGEAFDVNGKKVNLYLDAYFPDTLIDSLNLRPAIVMIHGGGFISGNKEQRKAECIAFAQRGFVAFSISYRLGWSANKPNDQAYAIYRAHQDANAALRFIVNQHKIYQLDTNWLFIGGSSAGAITAHNVVYTSQTEWEKLLPGVTNKLGELHNSTNQLTEKFTLKGLFNNWGAVFQESFNVEDMLPEISFHGDLDSTVQIGLDTISGLSGSKVIHDTLLKYNFCTELNVHPKGGHGIYTDTEGAIFRSSKATCFFKNIFCNTCNSSSTNEYIPASCANIKKAELTVNEDNVLFNIYPNPFNEKIYLDLPIQARRFDLYDVLGTLLISTSEIGNLQLTNLESGTYILRISTDNQLLNFKLQKN